MRQDLRFTSYVSRFYILQTETPRLLSNVHEKGSGVCFWGSLTLKIGMRADQRLRLRHRLRLLQASSNFPENFEVGDLLNGTKQLQSSHTKFDLQNIRDRFLVSRLMPFKFFFQI